MGVWFVIFIDNEEVVFKTLSVYSIPLKDNIASPDVSGTLLSVSSVKLSIETTKVEDNNFPVSDISWDTAIPGRIPEVLATVICAVVVDKTVDTFCI